MRNQTSLPNYLYTFDYARIGEALVQGYKRTKKSTSVSIFLCGGRMDDLRFARPNFVRAVKDEGNLTIRMPEGLFDDLLENKTYDLLGLEEILAHSVDAIVIFPESPGSFAELGAFSGNPHLRRKTICICEADYKSALSFINVGPIKILRNVKRSRVIYIKYKTLNDKIVVRALAGRIATQVRMIKRENPHEETGLFLLEDLIVDALFCVHTATLKEIKKLYTAKQIGVDQAKLEDIYELCIRTLLTGNRIEKNEEGTFQLSERTVRDIVARSSKDRLAMLSTVRVEAMNSRLRRHAETKSARMQRLLPSGAGG